MALMAGSKERFFSFNFSKFLIHATFVLLSSENQYMDVFLNPAVTQLVTVTVITSPSELCSDLR